MGYKVMEWKDVAKIIGSAAPVLGSLVGGPAGVAVGALVAQALGVDKTPGAISKALIDDPEALVKIKQIESTQQVELQKLLMSAEQNRIAADTAALQAEVADRGSARKMQTATHSLWPGVLSAITTTAVLAVIAGRMYGGDLATDPVTTQLVGSLTTGWGMCLSYWFGTTRGSRDKTAMLAERAKSTS